MEVNNRGWQNDLITTPCHFGFTFHWKCFNFRVVCVHDVGYVFGGGYVFGVDHVLGFNCVLDVISIQKYEGGASRLGEGLNSSPKLLRRREPNYTYFYPKNRK